MKITKENVKAILFIALCIILMFAVIWHFEGLVALGANLLAVIEPILIGACIAFIINIPMSFIEKKLFSFLLKPNKKGLCHPRFARLFSLVLSLALFIGAIALLLLVIIPQVIETISVIIASIPSFTERAIKFSQEYLDRFNISAQRITEVLLDGKELLTTVSSFLKQNLSTFILSATNIGSSVLSGVISGFLGLFISIYFLFDKEKILLQIKRLFAAILSKKTFNRLAHIVEISNNSFIHFISGQVLEAIILGLLCFSGMLIFGFPYAPVISVLIGVLALVPILGAWLGGIISALLILISNPIKAFWFIVFFLILQQLEGNLIYPRVVGKQVGLPGVWVLLSIVIGSNILGAAGALIAVPIASVAYILLSELVIKRESMKND